jgi:hypothetical protein
MQHTMVYGTTEPQDFQLYDDGDVLVGTGFTLEIEFREPNVSATVEWLAQATGQVRVTDMIGMSEGKTYHFRFKLTDQNDKIGYCPNTHAADEWFVVRV